VGEVEAEASVDILKVVNPCVCRRTIATLGGSLTTAAPEHGELRDGYPCLLTFTKFPVPTFI
jgi:hypothetical protein